MSPRPRTLVDLSFARDTVLYLCRECEKQISSAATRCPYCGAPPRPPLYGRPWSHRIAMRAALVLVLSLPLLMLPVVLRWHNGSWSPCDWVRERAPVTLAASASRPAGAYLEDSSGAPMRGPAAQSPGQCLRQWAEAMSQ